MAKKAVIDKDILGWADEQREALLERYVTILKVGQHPDLQQRSLDEKIASYCKDNNCDLLTGDGKAYMHYFKAGIKTIQITQYDYWTGGDRPVYLIEIVDRE